MGGPHMLRSVMFWGSFQIIVWYWGTFYGISHFAIHFAWYTYWAATIAQKATIHQVTTMLATSKNVLFPSPNHLLTIGADDQNLGLSPEHTPQNKAVDFVI